MEYVISNFDRDHILRMALRVARGAEIEQKDKEEAMAIVWNLIEAEEVLVNQEEEK